MKKTLKISVLFLMIITLFALSASAQDDVILWDNGYETEEYNYGGELKLGNNKIRPVGESGWFDSASFRFDNVYYEFDVKKSGYYSIEAMGDLYVMPFVSQDITDGVVYDETEMMLCDYEEYMVYLEEGECIFGVNFMIYGWIYQDDSYIIDLNIDYIAEEIADITVEDEYLEDIILGYHIATEYDEGNISGIPAKGKIIFSNGTETEFDQYVSVEYPDDISAGETEIAFVFPNFKKNYTVNITTFEEYISDVEIANPEDVTVVEQAFLPDVIYSPDVYCELVITKPDGSKKTEEIYGSYDFELKGDKYLTVWCDHYQKDDGKWYFIVEVGNKEYLSVPCETVPASFKTNYILYVNGITEYTLIMYEEFLWYLSDAVRISSGLSIKERGECVADAFSAIRENFGEMKNLTELFIDYII